MKPTLHVVVGAESFLKDRHVSRQRAKVPDWTFDVMEGKTTTVGDLLSFMETVPFGGEGRLVLVNEAERLKAGKGKDAGSLLLELAAAVPPDTLLILRGSDVTWKKETVPLSNFEGKRDVGATAVRFLVMEPPKPYDGGVDVANWVIKEAGELGHPMAKDAAMELVALAGLDLRTLANELTKLSAYVGPQAAFDVIAVRGGCSRMGTYPPYEVAERVLCGDARGALERFRISRTADGGYSLGVVGSLLAGVERALLIHDLLASGVGEDRVAERLGAHPYVTKKVHIPMAKRLTVAAAVTILHRLCEADLALKSSVPSRDAVVECLIVVAAGLVRSA